MKICFISDIHGIPKNLNVIEEVMKDSDYLVALGDLYYQGINYEGNERINSREVKEFLNGYKDKIICVRGNCDSDVDIKNSEFPICENLSLLFIDNKRIYLSHGKKYNMEKSYKIPKDSILVYGHEHIPYIKEKEGKTFINVGSISVPKDNHLPSYGIYEDNTFTIYDIEKNCIDQIKL